VLLLLLLLLVVVVVAEFADDAAAAAVFAFIAFIASSVSSFIVSVQLTLSYYNNFYSFCLMAWQQELVYPQQHFPFESLKLWIITKNDRTCPFKSWWILSL